uniref:Protein quiver n=1 Tax=Rhabditophanes sp. KR3021 TaxID=114890 RepID=A0AC35U9B0_9BILA
MIHLNLLISIFLFSIAQLLEADFEAISPEAIAAAAEAGKKLCFQCNMPEQCNSGLCIGDYCVKAVVNNKYVTKGCENNTSSTSLRPVPLNYAGGVDAVTTIPSTNNPSRRLETFSKKGCMTTEIFGTQQVICYCDTNFCNSSTKTNPPVIHLICLTLLLLIIMIKSPL